MVQKVVTYRLSDGRTVDNRRDAEREQSKLDIVAKLDQLLAKFPNGKEIAEGVIGAMLNIGWRPPVKKRALAPPKEPPNSNKKKPTG